MYRDAEHVTKRVLNQFALYLNTERNKYKLNIVQLSHLMLPECLGFLAV